MLNKKIIYTILSFNPNVVSQPNVFWCVKLVSLDLHVSYKAILLTNSETKSQSLPNSSVLITIIFSV